MTDRKPALPGAHFHEGVVPKGENPSLEELEMQLRMKRVELGALAVCRGYWPLSTVELKLERMIAEHPDKLQDRSSV